MSKCNWTARDANLSRTEEKASDDEIVEKGRRGRRKTVPPGDSKESTSSSLKIKCRHQTLVPASNQESDGKTLAVREGRSRGRLKYGPNSRKDAEPSASSKTPSDFDRNNNIDLNGNKAIIPPNSHKRKNQRSNLPEIDCWTEEEINQNPFLDECESGSTGASRSRSQTRPRATSEIESDRRTSVPSRARSEQSKESSRNTSGEGTPVILSREGSYLRTVDHETGEIFFKKLSRFDARDYKRKEPIFIPRLSSSSSIVLYKGDVDKESLEQEGSRRSQVKHRSHTVTDIQGNPIPSIFEEDEENDDGDDILVMKPTASAAPTAEKDTTIIAPLLPYKPKSILKKTPTSKGQSQSDKELISSKKAKDKIKDARDGGVSHRKECSKKARSRSTSPKNTNTVGNRTDTAKFPGKSTIPHDTKPGKEQHQEKPILSEGRMRTQERLPVISEGGTRARSPSNSKSRSKSSRRRLGHETATLIPTEVFEEIFSYLGSRDLEVCSRVCRRWKKLTDPYTRGPMQFEGRPSSSRASYSIDRCHSFVAYLQELEAKAYRPYTMRFSLASDAQITALCNQHGHRFRSSIRHMGALQLSGCSLRWRTFIHLLLSFVNLRTLCDQDSHHFSSPTTFSLCQKPKQCLEKEMKRQEYADLRHQLKKLKNLTLKRDTVDKGLVIYLNILTQGAKSVETFELTLGPWETPEGHERELSRSIPHFTRALYTFLSKNASTLKRVFLNWTNKGYLGYFANALDSLDNLKLDKLCELSLRFDGESLKTPKNLPKLKHFLEYHCTKSLKKITLSQLPLGQWWSPTLDSINEFIKAELFWTSFNFHLLIGDDEGLSPIHSEMELPLLQRFTSSIHFSIGSLKTRAVSQLLRKDVKQKGQTFPRVKSILVTFEPIQTIGHRRTDEKIKAGDTDSYSSFKSFSIGTICSCFVNLTELRISDRPVDHHQIFNRIIGRRGKKLGVSKAFVQNSDVQSICSKLMKLRILKLWVDLRKVDDHGITGIHATDIGILVEDDVNYSWDNFGHDLKANFSNLEDLEELSLKGLGKKVTNISTKFGFQNLKKLKLLEIWGEMTITRKGRLALRRYLRENGTVTNIRQYKL